MSQAIEDLFLLYELSLNLGQSLDYRVATKRFLKSLLSRRNLTAASVWWMKRGLETATFQAGGASLVLLEAIPSGQFQKIRLPLSHALWRLSRFGEAQAFSDETPEFSQLVPHALTSASVACAIFPLGEEGVLLLESAARDQFSPRFLGQLRAVVNNLATSIRGGQAHALLIDRTDELRLERDRNRSYLETVEAIMVALNRQGRITMINRKGCELLGYQEQELLDQPWFERCHEQPEGLGELYPIFLAIMEGRRRGAEYMESSILTRSGEQRLIAWHNAYLHDGEGQMVGILAAGEDISQRRAIELALRASEQRFDLALRAANDGLWDWNMLTHEVYFSPRWKSMLGYADHELENAFSTWERLIDDQGRAKTMALIEDCIQGKSDGFSLEFRMRHKDGHWIDVLSRSAVVRNEKGEAARMVGTHVDISERKAAEIHIREKESLLLSILDSTADGIVVSDSDGVILSANRRFQSLWNIPDELMHSRDDHLAFVADQLEDPQEFIAGVRRIYGSDDIFTDKIRFKDGRVYERFTVPLSLSSGVGRVWSFRDITENDQLMSALNYEKGFLKTLVHSLPDLIWLKDHDGVYLACNTRFEDFFGTEEKNIIGKTDYDFVDQELADFFRYHDKRAMDKGAPSVNEEWITFATDGRRALLETTKMPMQDAQGEKVIGILGIGHDITKRKQAEEQLQQAASVFEHANEGIMITDAKGTILDVNAAFTLMTGYSKAEVVGRNPRILNSGQHEASFYAEMWAVLLREGNWTGEVWNRRKNGEIYPELLTISTVRTPGGKVQRYVALFSDISAQKAHQRQLEHIAHHDALTGLPNRVLLADRLRQSLATAARRGEKIALAYLDLDGFKEVNDRFGHDAGDRLLEVLAERMKKILRETDTLARLGGDEFVAVLVDLANIDSTLPWLKRLLSTVAEPVHDEMGMLQVSASLGVSFYPQEDPVDADQLLRQADQAMYQAKLSGKNRYHLFDSAQDRDLRGRHERIERIREALLNREFRLYYQPKISLRSGEVIGVEGLIRWQHPRKGVLLPGSFLPSIDQHPLMIEVGDWVIETALDQIAAWQGIGLNLAVSINIDAIQLDQVNFIDKLRAALARYPDVHPSQIELEILETSALEDIIGVSEILRAGQELGVSFSLDDFGTGYSSLTYLKRLPVQTLKIDQSFVRDMLEDPDDMAILEGTLGLAAAFRRQVIAEGVETEAQGEMLLQLGCEYVQGFAIAAPMSADHMPGWVDHWRSQEKCWINGERRTKDRVSPDFRIVDHRDWIRELRRFLESEQTNLPLLNSQKCPFGHWLEVNHRLDAASKSVYQTIENLHEQVHNKAVELVAIKERGQSALALKRFEEIVTLRDELVALCQQITQ